MAVTILILMPLINIFLKKGSFDSTSNFEKNKLNNNRFTIALSIILSGIKKQS